MRLGDWLRLRGGVRGGDAAFRDPSDVPRPPYASAMFSKPPRTIDGVTIGGTTLNDTSRNAVSWFDDSLRPVEEVVRRPSDELLCFDSASFLLSCAI